MKQLIYAQKMLINNNVIKIISLIFGYALWYFSAYNQIINYSVDVPVCFYGLKENLKVISTENINVKFQSSRSEFRKLNLKNLALHIDLTSIKNKGTYKIYNLNNKLDKKNHNTSPSTLFLDNKIKVIECLPSILMCKVVEKEDYAN